MSKYLNIEEYTQHFIQQSNTLQENVARLIAQGAYDRAEKELDEATASGDSLYLLSLIAELKGNSERATQLCQKAAEAGSAEAIAMLLPKCETFAEWREAEGPMTSIFEATQNDESLWLVNQFTELNEPSPMVDDETQQAVYARVELQKNSCREALAIMRRCKEKLEERWKMREAKKDLLRNIYKLSQYIQSSVWILAIVIATLMSYSTRTSGSANVEMTIVSLACIAAYVLRIVYLNSSGIAEKEIIATPCYCISSVISDLLWLPLLAVPAFVMYSTTFSDMELLQSFAKVLVWIVVLGAFCAALANEESRAIVIVITVVLLILFITLVASDILTWWGIACLPLVLGFIAGYLALCCHCMKKSDPVIILGAIRPAVAITFAYFSTFLLLGTLTNPLRTLVTAYEVIFKTFNLR